MSFEIPEHVRPIRDEVRRFVEERIQPVESLLDERGRDEAGETLRGLMALPQ